MTSESKRLDLYNRLQEVLGNEPATTLMTYLPPIAGPDLLTKSVFEKRMTEVDERFVRVDKRFDQVDDRFIRVEDQLDHIDEKVDRVLLAVVAGMFILFASIISSAIWL